MIKQTSINHTCVLDYKNIYKVYTIYSNAERDHDIQISDIYINKRIFLSKLPDHIVLNLKWIEEKEFQNKLLKEFLLQKQKIAGFKHKEYIFKILLMTERKKYKKYIEYKSDKTIGDYAAVNSIYMKSMKKSITLPQTFILTICWSETEPLNLEIFNF